MYIENRNLENIFLCKFIKIKVSLKISPKFRKLSHNLEQNIYNIKKPLFLPVFPEITKHSIKIKYCAYRNDLFNSLHRLQNHHPKS